MNELEHNNDGNIDINVVDGDGHLLLHALHPALGELQLLRCVPALLCRTQGPSHLGQ